MELPCPGLLHKSGLDVCSSASKTKDASDSEGVNVGVMIEALKVDVAAKFVSLFSPRASGSVATRYSNTTSPA